MSAFADELHRIPRRSSILGKTIFQYHPSLFDNGPVGQWSGEAISEAELSHSFIIKDIIDLLPSHYVNSSNRYYIGASNENTSNAVVSSPAESPDALPK